MTPLEEAKQVLANCLFVPVEKIADDADIDSIATLDSLSFEAIALEVETRVGHEVDPMRLLELRSVKDLAAILSGAP